MLMHQHEVCMVTMGMDEKLKIDPKKVEYDGRSFRLIIGDEAELIKRLKEKQAEILKDIAESDDNSSESNGQAARGAQEIHQ